MWKVFFLLLDDVADQCAISLTNLTLSVKSCSLMEWNGLSCNKWPFPLCCLPCCSLITFVVFLKVFFKEDFSCEWVAIHFSLYVGGGVILSNKFSCKEIMAALHDSTKQFMNEPPFGGTDFPFKLKKKDNKRTTNQLWCQTPSMATTHHFLLRNSSLNFLNRELLKKKKLMEDNYIYRQFKWCLTT